MSGKREKLARKKSVRVARETERRLRVRTKGILTKVLDITYAAIRRRPGVFLLMVLMLGLAGCHHRPNIKWHDPHACRMDDPHNTSKNCTLRTWRWTHRAKG